MITDETIRKAARARELLIEVREALEGHGASIPADGGWADPRLFEKQEARLMNSGALHAADQAIDAVGKLSAKVTPVWESLGKQEVAKRQILTWEPTNHAGWRGVAAGAVFFTISWHTRRGDPDYVLRSEFPGIQLDAKDDDPDSLRARAEKAMAAWAARLGGAS